MAGVSGVAISLVLIYLIFKVKIGLDSLKILSTKLFIPARLTEKTGFGESAQTLAISDSSRCFLANQSIDRELPIVTFHVLMQTIQLN